MVDDDKNEENLDSEPVSNDSPNGDEVLEDLSPIDEENISDSASEAPIVAEEAGGGDEPAQPKAPIKKVPTLPRKKLGSGTTGKNTVQPIPEKPKSTKLKFWLIIAVFVSPIILAGVGMVIKVQGEPLLIRGFKNLFGKGGGSEEDNKPTKILLAPPEIVKQYQEALAIVKKLPDVRGEIEKDEAGADKLADVDKLCERVDTMWKDINKCTESFNRVKEIVDRNFEEKAQELQDLPREYVATAIGMLDAERDKLSPVSNRLKEKKIKLTPKEGEQSGVQNPPPEQKAVAPESYKRSVDELAAKLNDFESKTAGLVKEGLSKDDLQIAIESVKTLVADAQSNEQTAASLRDQYQKNLPLAVSEFTDLPRGQVDDLANKAQKLSADVNGALNTLNDMLKKKIEEEEKAKSAMGSVTNPDEQPDPKKRKAPEKLVNELNGIMEQWKPMMEHIRNVHSKISAVKTMDDVEPARQSINEVNDKIKVLTDKGEALFKEFQDLVKEGGPFDDLTERSVSDITAVPLQLAQSASSLLSTLDARIEDMKAKEKTKQEEEERKRQEEERKKQEEAEKEREAKKQKIFDETKQGLDILKEILAARPTTVEEKKAIVEKADQSIKLFDDAIALCQEMNDPDYTKKIPGIQNLKTKAVEVKSKYQ